MANVQRTDKMLRKDPHPTREAQEELQEEIRSSGTKPRQEHINRDRARGDSDRTGDHHDEDVQ
jgi:hypothetical protein